MYQCVWGGGSMPSILGHSVHVDMVYLLSITSMTTKFVPPISLVSVAALIV